MVKIDKTKNKEQGLIEVGHIEKIKKAIKDGCTNNTQISKATGISRKHIIKTMALNPSLKKLFKKKSVEDQLEPAEQLITRVLKITIEEITKDKQIDSRMLKIMVDTAKWVLMTHPLKELYGYQNSIVIENGSLEDISAEEKKALRGVLTMASLSLPKGAKIPIADIRKKKKTK